MNIDKFVAVNNVQEVSNAMLMDKSYNPTPDGLLSTEIFGHSAAERRITFGYINLNCHVFQPLAYKNVKARIKESYNCKRWNTRRKRR